MFQFPGFASAIVADAGVASGGLPHSDIRDSMDIAPTRGFSQLVTSFFASESLGILHAPFSPFL